LDITATLSGSLPVPVIASGGAGNMEHFKEVFETANADAALAASIFHYKENRNRRPEKISGSTKN
jgi:cyclase